MKKKLRGKAFRVETVVWFLHGKLIRVQTKPLYEVFFLVLES